MFFSRSWQRLLPTAQSDPQSFGRWQASLASSLASLRQLAGVTEKEFLQVGEQMQGIHRRTVEITKEAAGLVEVASGARMQTLIGRLRQMIGDIEAYLSRAHARGEESCSTLGGVQTLLDQVARPLAGFQDMNMTLHMLGVSIKIESARLGTMGNEFVNLALDVEKLSRQVDDKSEAILGHRQSLLAMIAENLAALQSAGTAHDSEVMGIVENSSASLRQLEAANDRFTALGARVVDISTEVAANIGEVVASLQFNDINRQQVEHVLEALEPLSASLAKVSEDEEGRRAVIVEVGNVCELQEAQLHFASKELHTAVTAIIDNLRQVGDKQTALGEETRAVSGNLEGSDSSFIDDISRGMGSITKVLTSCVSTDHDMSETMKGVATTVGEITSFVQAIDDIGFEIVLLALNAQIKAAHAGERGLGLGVLAEAIRQLSDEAVLRTNTVTLTLNEIHKATEHLALGSSDDEAELCARLMTTEGELSDILTLLTEMDGELLALVAKVGGMVADLGHEVERVTAGIDVHERAQAMADEVLATLAQMVSESRQLFPASTDFQEHLRLMEERYTMESERRIHEAIAQRHSGEAAVAALPLAGSGEGGSDSEFGDNVDLF